MTEGESEAWILSQAKTLHACCSHILPCFEDAAWATLSEADKVRWVECIRIVNEAERKAGFDAFTSNPDTMSPERLQAWITVCQDAINSVFKQMSKPN